MEAYVKLGLRAQPQCLSTQEAIAEIKEVGCRAG